MNRCGLIQFMKEIGTLTESLLKMLNTDEKSFKASYTHKLFHTSDISKRQALDIYGQPHADEV